MRFRITDKGRFKRKRGIGALETYVPWIWVTDFSSNGLRLRVFGVKVKRLHHLLSLLEARVFYILESMDHVIDIREQYPLFPTTETLEIAAQNNIRHPKVKGIPSVRTTDFLVVTKTGTVAITVKYKKDLKKKRVREKLEIERQYWERRGIEFYVITECDITKNEFRNAERIRAFSKRPHTVISNQAFLEKLKLHQTTPNIRTKTVLERIAEDVQESFALIHHLFLHLIFRRLIRFDFSKTLAIRSTIGDLCI